MTKICCQVFGKDALIVGYAPGRKGKIHAVVICEGELKAVRLKDIQLSELPEELSRPSNVVEMKQVNG